MKYLAITGRQQELSIAELESAIGGESIVSVLGFGCILSKPADIDRLGGTQKIFSLEKAEDISVNSLVEYTNQYTDANSITSRLNLAINSLNIDFKQKVLFEVKEKLSKQGLNIRVIKAKKSLLTTAESVNNKMHTTKGLEVCILSIENDLYIGKLEQVQNLKAYTDRDRFRPKRDSKVGMLPPKLAQIIINIASPSENAIILDPFCGTGVLLQEAAIMGFQVYGTDVSQKMIDYTKENLEWAQSKYRIGTNVKLEKGDAKKHQWTNFDTIACETYLGEAFSGNPTEAVIKNQQKEVNALVSKFLKNAAVQLNSGQRICIAAPNWKIGSKNYHLPLVDKLDQLGYTWSEFSHVDVTKLIYRRPGQVVGRQLLTLVKK